MNTTKLFNGAMVFATAATLFTGCASGLAHKSASGTAAKPKQIPLSEDDAKAIGKVTLLFVQNAQGVTIGDGKMVLKGVSPTTIYFSDRPERIAGHMATKEFVPFWSEGRTASFRILPMPRCRRWVAARSTTSSWNCAIPG